MINFFIFLFLINFFAREMILGNIGHTKNGTEYGLKAVNAYANSNHGPDGNLFLDPYFKKDIENLAGEKILDAGCGAAPWSIYAAQNGGKVYAIDIQENMIQTAKQAICKANLNDKISIVNGDVASLPYDHDFFDKEISICVGCNLPLDAFEKHFSECHRTLKHGGIAVIGAPTSLDVVFSDGSTTESETYAHLQNILNSLPDHPKAELILEKLANLTEVLSATFYIKKNRLCLVVNKKDLKNGEKIWRKLPKLVVPNCYYSQDFYVKVFEKYNFVIQKIDTPHFASEDDRVTYNAQAPVNAKLGHAYVAHAPFVIFHLVKK